MRTGCLRCLRSLTVTCLVIWTLFVESGSHAIGGSNGAFAGAYAGTGASALGSVDALKEAGESVGAYDRHKGIRIYSPSERISQDKDIDRDVKSYGVVPEPGASHDGIKGSNSGYNKHSCSKCKWENDDYWEQDEPEEEGDENDGHECDNGQYRPNYGLRHHQGGRKPGPGLRPPGVHKIGPIGVDNEPKDRAADLAPTRSGYTTPTNFAAKTTPKSSLNPFAYTALKPGYTGLTAGGLADTTVYVHPQHGVPSNSLPDWNEGTTLDFESSTKPTWEPVRDFVTTPKPFGVQPSSRKPWNVGHDIDAPASTTRPGQGWTTAPDWSTSRSFTGSFAVTTKPGSNWNTGLKGTLASGGLSSSRKPWSWDSNYGTTKAVDITGCPPSDPTCTQDKQIPIKLSATPVHIGKTKGDESPGDASFVPQSGSAISPPLINYGSPNENNNWLYGHHATQSSSAHAGATASSSVSHHVEEHNFGKKDNPFLNKPASTQTLYSGINPTYPNTYDPRSFSDYNTPERENTWPSSVRNTFGTTVGPYGGISSSDHHATQSAGANAGASATSSVSHLGTHNFGKKDNPFFNKPTNIIQTPYSGINQAYPNTYDPRVFSDYNTPERPSGVTNTFGTTIGPYGGISSSGHHATQSSNANAGASATSSASHHVGAHNFGKKDNPFFNKPASTQTPSFSDYITPERERPSTVVSTFGTNAIPYGGITSSGHRGTQSTSANAGSSATSDASHVGTNFGKKDNPFFNNPTSIQTLYKIDQVRPNTYDPRLYGGTSSSSIVPRIQGSTLSAGNLPGSPTGSGVYDHPGVTKPTYGSGITSTSSWLNTGQPASGSSTWNSLGTHTGAHAGFPASTIGFGTTKSPFGHTNIPDPSLGSPYSGTELKQHGFHSTSNSASASASSNAHGHHQDTYNTHHLVGTTPIYQGTSSYPGVKGASRGSTGPTYGIVPHGTHSDAGTGAWSNNKPSGSGSKTWSDKEPGSETPDGYPGTVSGTWPGRHPGSFTGVWPTRYPGSESGTWPSKKPEDGSKTRPGIFGYTTVDPHGGSSKGNYTGDNNKPGESCNETVSGPSGVIKTYYPAGFSDDGHVPHNGNVYGSVLHSTGAYPGTNIGCQSGDSSCNQGVTPQGSVHWNPSNPFLFKIGGGTPSHASRSWNSGTTAKPIGKENPFLDSSWSRPKPDYSNSNANNDQNVIPYGEGSTKPIGQGNPFLDDSKRRGGIDVNPNGGVIPFGGRKLQGQNPFLGSRNSGSNSPSYSGEQSDPGYPGLGTSGSGGYGSVKGGSHGGASSQTNSGSYASTQHPGGVFGAVGTGGGSSGSVSGGFGDYPGTGIGQFNTGHPALIGSRLPGSLGGAHAQASSFAHAKPLHFSDTPESGNDFDRSGSWSSSGEQQHQSNSWSSSSALSSSSSGSNHRYWANHPTEPPPYMKD